MKDNINPSHYRQGNIECIDAISAAVIDLEGVEAMLVGNAMKYLWRWKYKNGTEDLRKAQWYISKLIDVVERKQPHPLWFEENARIRDNDGYPEPEYGMAGELGGIK